MKMSLRLAVSLVLVLLISVVLLLVLMLLVLLLLLSWEEGEDTGWIFETRFIMSMDIGHLFEERFGHFGVLPTALSLKIGTKGIRGFVRYLVESIIADLGWLAVCTLYKWKGRGECGGK